MQYNLENIIEKSGATGVSFDSQKVRTGDIFVAIRGEKFDGNEFINEAIKAGAQIIISDINPEAHRALSDNIQNKIIYVDNARAALSMAAGFFFPKLPEHLIAVTGTNGKTSVASYCQQLFNLLAKNSCSIGTLGVQCTPFIPGILPANNNLTTADPLRLRQILHLLTEHNINYVAFEASSHGLEQERIKGIKVNAAAFTSFSHEHLDYHKTMDNYLKSKLKLFTDNLLPGGCAVISSEIGEFDFIKKFLSNYRIEIIKVGKSGDIKINSTQQSIHGQKINFSFNGNDYSFDTKIIASFQASNLLIAAMLVHKVGFAFDEIIKVLPQVIAVKGRLERVTASDHPFHIFVDYAHTPDSLASSLGELKKILTLGGKLQVLFGCGGDRDKAKRPVMGEIAAKVADSVVITDDNPRTEDASLIRQAIMSGCYRASLRDNIIEIPGRRNAINSAIKCLKNGDILLIAGKGHEDYQIIGNNSLPFSDVEVATLAIKEINEDI